MLTEITLTKFHLQWPPKFNGQGSNAFNCIQFVEYLKTHDKLSLNFKYVKNMFDFVFFSEDLVGDSQRTNDIFNDKNMFDLSCHKKCSTWSATEQMTMWALFS